MKRSILLITFIFLFAWLYAQQGINLLLSSKKWDDSLRRRSLIRLQARDSMIRNLDSLRTVLNLSTVRQGNKKAVRDSMQGERRRIRSLYDVNLKEIPTLGIEGLTNLNTEEAFKSLNSSGKLAGYIRPFKWRNAFTTFNFSFNINASNNDSLLASTFLFPDVGRNSFYISAEHSFRVMRSKEKGMHLIIPFFEFSNKKIKGSKDDSTLYFSTVNYTGGIRYQFLFRDGDVNAAFSVAPYFSVVNVPDEDNEDYRYLFTKDKDSKLKSAVCSWGCKIAFQYDKIQFFADMRQVIGSETEIPVRDLRGFNSNIGILLNVDLLER